MKKIAIVVGAAVLAVVLLAGPAAAASATAQPTNLVRVLFVGNNWDGTADVIRQGGTAEQPTFRRVARLNIIPDRNQRMLEIFTNPVRLGYFMAIRQLIGEGHDQFVDDMFTSKDGRLLVVSRPSFADVVGINLDSGRIAWRFRVDGQRSDHMAMSPDGRHVAVSASTGNVVHILDTYTGREVGRFLSGDSPHESNYAKDGSKIYHASIGLVYTPADRPLLDSTKGDRRFQIVDAKTNRIVRKIDMGNKLAAAGYPNMSSAVRPMALAPGEQFVYFQVSFFHGFVEYDLVRNRVKRVARLPNLVPEVPREQYLLDSAHHGIAMNPARNAPLRRRHHGRLCGDRLPQDVRVQAHPDRRGEALLGDQQRRRALLLRLLERQRPNLGDLLQRPQRGRQDPGRRPSAADADGVVSQAWLRQHR